MSELKIKLRVKDGVLWEAVEALEWLNDLRERIRDHPVTDAFKFERGAAAQLTQPAEGVEVIVVEPVGPMAELIRAYRAAAGRDPGERR